MDANLNESQENQSNSKQSMDMIDIITANTQVNTIISLLEKINFNVIYSMLASTPENMKESQNFLALQATFQYFLNIEKVFAENSKPDEKIDENLIISPFTKAL